MIETALVDLIDGTTAECAQQQRPDLHNRLRQIRNRVLDPAQLVLVVGESKQGKSELINAVVNSPVCRAGEEVTTVVPTIVRHSEEPSALLVEQEPAHGPAALERQPVAIERVRDEIDQALSAGRPLARSEIGLPRAVLKNGLVLMDTPGVGSVSSSLTSTTLAVLAEADALLMVSDATQELTTNELNFLSQITTLCPNIALVQPKTDITPHWRRVVQVNRKHLSNAGVNCNIFPVSSTVRFHATNAMDGDLNSESGFPPLLEYLRSDMASRQEQMTRNLVAHNVTDALDQLTESLKSELANQNSRTATETLLELESAQRRADDMRRISNRWQKTLNDGIQELYADIEFDFRERSWAVLHQAYETFEEADPNTTWEDFSDWLFDSLTAAVAETFDWLNERREQLAEKVADQLLQDQRDSAPALSDAVPGDPLGRVPDPKAPTNADYTRFDQVLTGLRGSYGGLLMFGLVTSTAFGLGLMNVVSVSAGLFLGHRALYEEKESRLKRRQAEARSATQRYVEHVIFQVNKEAKDTIRHTHRMLHDHFNQITEESQVQISNTIQTIKRGVEQSAVEREQRAREIRKKLEELALLRRRATNLASSNNRITAA